MDLQAGMSMRVLKQRMEGERRRVNRRPEVYLTVRELALQDDGAITFSTREFSLSGLRVHALVEITGTHAQIARDLGQEAASRLWKKATGLVRSKPGPAAPAGEAATLVGKRSDPAAEAEAGQGGPAVQTCVVELTLSVSKEAGEERVRARIKDLEVGENTFTSKATAKRALGNARVRAMIEAGISKVVRHALSKKLNKAKANAFKKACGCFMKCFRSPPPGE
mmetsp:Transcript_102795/g.331674  ORF Transcript_102795/g.331674 Transcript_102795/m.331674 type:complete len:223 (+) Transcript_102795:224-892(+)